MDFNELSEEQMQRAKDCTTPEELLEFARSEGYQLSEEELEGVAGGGVWSSCNSPYYCDADAGCYGRTR